MRKKTTTAAVTPITEVGRVTSAPMGTIRLDAYIQSYLVIIGAIVLCLLGDLLLVLYNMKTISEYMRDSPVLSLAITALHHILPILLLFHIYT